MSAEFERDFDIRVPRDCVALNIGKTLLHTQGLSQEHIGSLPLAFIDGRSPAGQMTTIR